VFTAVVCTGAASSGASLGSRAVVIYRPVTDNTCDIRHVFVPWRAGAMDLYRLIIIFIDGKLL
jgi:hypothetical protein